MPLPSLVVERAARGAGLCALAFVCIVTSPARAVEIDVFQGLSKPGKSVAGGDTPPAVPRDRQLGPESAERHYLRAAFETVAVLGIGVAQYWMHPKDNSRDWDFPRWSDRLSSSGIRFDNNTHVTNNVLHPLAGSAYYGLSRANGLGVGTSALYSLAASAVWEWGLEWREKVSVNDMVATTVGGMSAGEFFIQLASYLNSAPAETNFAQDVAKTTLGFPVWVHDRVDDRRAPSAPARDNLGFSSSYHHRFTLGFENAWIDDGAGTSQEIRGVALSSQLVSLPGYLEPQSFSTTFARGNFTRGAFDLLFDGTGVQEAALKFDAVLLGYYTQQAHPAVIGALVGLATGLEFLDRDTLKFGDQYGLLHCFGPEVGTTLKGNGYQLNLRGRAYADFAAIRSLAWPQVKAEAPGDTYKSSLSRQYQYNFGISGRLAADLQVQALRLFAELGWGGYRSIQGIDRFQEEITRDLAGEELLAEQHVGIAIEPPETPLRFHAEYESYGHESTLGGRIARREERRLVVGAGLVF